MDAHAPPAHRKQMKILHVSNYYPERNTGAAGTIMALGEAMRTAGNSVNLSWRNRPLSRWGHNFSRFFEIPARQLEQAQAELAKEQYDAVIVHQPHGWQIFQKLAPRHPSCVFINFSHGWEMCVPKFKPETRSLVRPLKDAVATHYIRRHCDRAARLADGMVVLNRLDADYLIQRHRLQAEKVCLLTLGLDPWLLNGPGRPAAVAGQPARFLYIGNYVAQKNCAMMESALVELARENSTFTFTCVTHDDKHAGLKARLGPILGERLTVLGWSPREQLAELMRRHDYLLFPSAYEGFGKVAHEAMASGLAVVGTRCGVLADHATDGVEALLSLPGDRAKFLAHLRRAAANPGLANTLGAQAREKVKGDTWGATAHTFYGFIERLRATKLFPKTAS